MFGFKRWRRRRLRQRPLSSEQLEVLERRVPYYKRLTVEEQSELQGLVQVFLAEKDFEGCGGLEITEEIRVTVAAQACVLLLHRDTDFYPGLRSVLVYPDAFTSEVAESQPDGSLRVGPEARIGESWDRGLVVLSWDDVMHGAADIHDGQNVVFHEFAHQLDTVDGAVDGAPLLKQRSMYVAWARVLSKEYDRLLADIKRQRPTVLDHYGASDPAEFFAVATECFFEKSKELRRRRPELYEQLRMFYQQDPAARSG